MEIRRKRGSGCIRKLSGNRKKPWQVIISRKKIDETRVRIHLGCFQTKHQAESYLESFLSQPSPRCITLEKLFQLFRKYFKYHFPEKNDRMYDMGYAYSASIRNKPLLSLGIADYVNVLIHGSYRNQKGDLQKISPSVQPKVKSCFNNLLDFACDYFYLSKNPLREVSLKELLI